jgi:hypothetical protein
MDQKFTQNENTQTPKENDMEGNSRKQLNFKRGAVREDGMTFWKYRPLRDGGGEWWVSPEKFAEKKEKDLQRRRAKGIRERTERRVTVPVPKRGDLRDDGYRFSQLRSDGRELWCSPEAWAKSTTRWLNHNVRIKQTVWNAKRRAARKGWPFDLDFEFLASIFPKDGRCPLSKELMVWGASDGIGNSPSVDRIDCAKGYTKDNVWWISQRENGGKRRYERVLPPWVKVFADDEGSVTFDPPASACLSIVA